MEKSESRIGSFSSRKSQWFSGGKEVESFPRMKVCLEPLGFPHSASLSVSFHEVGNESRSEVWGVPTLVGTPEVST